MRVAIAIALGTGFVPAALCQSILFENATSAAGLDFPLQFVRAGVAVGDVDGDGWQDVCFFGGTATGPRLFHNNGDGTFSDATALAFPDGGVDSVLGLLADMDNDGDADLVMIRRRNGDYNDNHFAYARNDGGVYTTVSQGEPLAVDRTHQLGGMAIGDVDVDGDLDVVVAYQFGMALCLLNDGAGAFSDGTAAFGANLATNRPFWSITLADFNGDLLPDLHATVDGEPDYHARNIGGGAFIDVSTESGVTNVGSDMGLAVGDVQNDGDLDIYSTNIAFGVLYINNGGDVFRNRAAGRGCDQFANIGWGADFGDFDHDGDEDLAVVTFGGGGPLFENDGTGRFSDVSATAGIFLAGQAFVPFDYDRDGDLDALVVNLIGVPRLYRNISPGLPDRHWLIVRARGVQANRDGVGSRITVTTTDGTQMREVLGTTSFYSGRPPVAHFGLGAAEVVDSLTVRWNSGAGRTLTAVEADQELTVSEPLMRDGRLVGDADADGDVDLDDLTALLIHFDSQNATAAEGDSDGDGDVDLTDLAVFLAQFGADLIST
ncbi:MAG: CRTAC1 family protein [Planctomycetota bacterium]|nr:MAG: CRTAC1 family protein [Planctomycetota bacterium]